MILAAAAAYDATQDARLPAVGGGRIWLVPGRQRRRARGGRRRHAAAATMDFAEDGVNVNQGAESTLMWLTALETIRLLRSRAMAGPRSPAARGCARPGRARA